MNESCLRCSATRVVLPWGFCLGDGTAPAHPIVEHYDQSGNQQPAGDCPEPR